MASAADKKRWDKLHADLAKADSEKMDTDIALRVKYGDDATRSSNRHWMSRAERAKLEKAEARVEKIHDQIYELVERISPRDWGRGVPGHWVTRKLTWEDAIRPKDEPLSVVVPGSYGYPDGYVKEEQHMRSRRQPSLPGFPDIPEKLDIQIPNMPQWEQIGGDMDPGAHGGLIATADGDHIELLEIQPVREYVGDRDATDVGFPFWTKEAWFDLSDLDPNHKDVKSALDSIGMSLQTLEDDFTPTQRALVIAEALASYGRSEESSSGWSSDLPDHQVKWWDGKVESLPDHVADEDESFAREVLLDNLDVDYEKYGPDEKNPTSGLKVEARGGNVEIVEWTDIQDATGEEQPEGEQVTRRSFSVDLSELFDPKGEHRGTYSRDDKSVGIIELAKMDDEERESAIVSAAIAYAGYWNGDEEFVDAIGD